MNDSRLELKIIRVAAPCEKAWEQMAGDDKIRFCDHCQKHVHNLSAMNLNEAHRLTCQAAGSVCVLFEKSPDGRVLTLDYKPAVPRKRWFWPSTIAASIGAIAAAAGIWIHGQKPAPPPSTIVVGALPAYSFPPSTQKAPTVGCNSPASLSDLDDVD